MSSAAPRRTAVAAGLAAVVALGSWPHLFALRLWPTSRDGALWILRGLPGADGWVAWVFATQQFVGYRPVAALSYSIDGLAGPLSAWPYRATDLALHAGCALLVFALYRRAAPDLPRWGGLVAAALFVAHPVVTEVVPLLARRSYSLATLFVLAALCAALPAAGRPPQAATWRRALAVGALLALGVLSNETAIVAVPVAAWLLLPDVGRRRGGRALAGAAAALSAGVVAALALRFAVVGGSGGYPASADRIARAFDAVVATWSGLGALAAVRGAVEGRVAPWLYGAAAAVSAYYAVRAGSSLRARPEPSAAPSFRGTIDSRAIPALLVSWLVLGALLYAASGVWFPRQLYPLLVPFSLLVAVVLAETVARGAAPARSALHLVPQAALIGWIILHSPVLHGPDPQRVAAWKRTDALLRQTHGDLAALPPSSTVQLVTPFYERPEAAALRAREAGGRPPIAADLPAQWTRGLLHGRGIEVEPLLVFAMDPGEPPGACRLLETGGRPVLGLDAGRRFWLLGPGARVEQTAGAVRVALEADLVAHSTHLYVYDGGAGRLVALGVASRAGEAP